MEYLKVFVLSEINISPITCNESEQFLPSNFVESAQYEDEVNGDAAYGGRHLEGDCSEAGKNLVQRAEERRRADV